MLKIEYNEWAELCNNLKKYIIAYRKFYLQLYPITEEILEKIKEESYFNRYIKTGAFLWDDTNWIKCENPSMNVDGTLRRRNLISPLFYIIYIYIGNKINKLYRNKRNTDIEVYYAGNLDKNIYHYKNEYNNFCKKTIKLSKNYKYYIKTDIKSFFSSINMDLLFSYISSNINETELNITLEELNFMEEFIKFIGDGKLPQIEEGITSSYLATKIYLEEMDNSLYAYLKENDKIKKFKIIRYVDDLYIFLDTNINREKIYEQIINFINDIMYEYSITININKTEIKEVGELKTDLKHLSYLDEEYIRENINEIINDTDLYYVLFDILIENNITREKYNLILKNRLGNIDNYTENEIFNSIIYTNNSIVSNKNMIDILKLVIDQKFDFIYCDPKRLTILIVKTKDEEIIKLFLNKLYQKKKVLEWNRYDKIAVEQYLLQRQFINEELINNLSSIRNLKNYITCFINKDWSKVPNSQVQAKLCEKLIYEKDTRYFFLYAYFKFEDNKGNYELKHSFFKSYFEAISAVLYARNEEKVLSYERMYTEGSLRKNYERIMGNNKYNDDIHKVCQLRNNNMVNHAGGNNNGISIYKEIDDNIIKIKNIIKEAIEIIYNKHNK